MDSIRIIHFSDILCIWAYIAQVRMDELAAAYGDRIRIEYRLFPVFGHTQKKFAEQWGERGGAAGYGRHVQKLAGQFEHVRVHDDAWAKVAPASSLPAHLYLCAVGLAETEERIGEGSFVRVAWALRQAFFAEAADIADRNILRTLIEREAIPADLLDDYIHRGPAYARLSEDIQVAREQAVTASPTLTFNEGRQRLTGNVGYRIIEANVKELLERPQVQHSWC